MEKRPFTYVSLHPSYYLLAVILCCFLLSVLSTQSFSSNQAVDQNNGKNTLYFFWGQGCPHCAAAKPFLEELKKKYPGFKVSAYEIYNSPENLEIMRNMAKSHGTEPQGCSYLLLR